MTINTEDPQAPAPNGEPTTSATLEKLARSYIEALVRFAELLVLAALFQYAARATGDLFLLAIGELLTVGAMLITARFAYSALQPLFPRSIRTKWGLAVGLAGALFVGAQVFFASRNVSNAISDLAKTQGTATQSSSTRS